MIKNKSFVWGLVAAPMALLGLSVAVASNVSTPNVFVPGTPIMASEVNQNFSDQSTAINDNDARIAAIEAALAAPLPSFSAAVADQWVPGTGTIIFDAETHDDGNVYDPTTGAFTAPKEGVYNLAFVTHFDGSGGVIQMLKNGLVELGSTWAKVGSSGGPSEDEDIPASIIVTTKLQAGDVVTVERAGNTSVLWGSNSNGPFTYLSGHLIQNR